MFGVPTRRETVDKRQPSTKTTMPNRRLFSGHNRQPLWTAPRSRAAEEGRSEGQYAPFAKRKGRSLAPSAPTSGVCPPRRLIWIIIVASFVWDFAMIGFGFSRIYPLTLAFLFAMGIAGMVWMNAIINLFQREAIGEMRGRVMSLFTIGMGLFPLGWAFGGALSALIGNEPTLIISALGGTPLVLLAMLLAPGLRRS